MYVETQTQALAVFFEFKALHLMSTDTLKQSKIHFVAAEQ